MARGMSLPSLTADYLFSYEGTGRSLSLKLIHQLRQQSATGTAVQESKNVSTAVSGSGARVLREIVLETPIRCVSTVYRQAVTGVGAALTCFL